MTRIVLVVEDNPSDEKLTLRALSRAGSPARAVVTRDGEEALDYMFRAGAYAQGDHPLPSLVLLDLKLPRLDGRGVLRRMRADGRTLVVPVVVLTTSLQREDIVDCYTLGANAYVRKPVDLDEFVETMRTLVKFWLVVNESPGRMVQ